MQAVHHHYEQVYYVEAPKNVTMNPVAIRPEIFEERVQWQDTSKGTIIKLGTINNQSQLKEDPPEVIEITAKSGAQIKLIKLTLDIYNNKVKNRVWGQPTFDSDEEVRKYYLTSDFEIY